MYVPLFSRELHSPQEQHEWALMNTQLTPATTVAQTHRHTHARHSTMPDNMITKRQAVAQKHNTILMTYLFTIISINSLLSNNLSKRLEQ